MPDEITTLTQLQDLSISGLNLAELPQNFSQLKNLESLDLTHNKLNISAEWGKLKSLPKLREVTVIGNVVDTAEVHRWMDERPGLKVIYHWNDIKEEW
ncbi:MAG: hypothetical protein AAF992_03315 [Bacteroidota bacterium]